MANLNTAMKQAAAGDLSDVTLAAETTTADQLDTKRATRLMGAYPCCFLYNKGEIRSDGKPSPGKDPKGAGWQKKPRKAREWDGEGVGVICGPVAGYEKAVHALDFDIVREPLAEKMHRWIVEFIDRRNPEGFALKRIGKPPKFLVPFVLDESEPLKKTEFTTDSYYPPGLETLDEAERCQLETLGAGNQFVAYHTHPDTGAPYHWDMMGAGFLDQLHDTTPADLLTLTRADLKEIRQAFERIMDEGSMVSKKAAKARQREESNYAGASDHNASGEPISKTGHTVHELLQFIPNDCDYDEWFRLLAAIDEAYRAVGSNGEHEARRWSVANGKHDDAEFNKTWNSLGKYNGTPANIGTLVYLAQQNGLPSKKKTPPTPVDPATIFQSDPKEDEGARPGEFAVPDSCKESFVVQFGAEIARVTEMPESTVIMTTMAALSGILSTTYTTGYPDGTRLPIGLNVVAEQPPGAAKSRALNKVIKPWLKAIKRYNGKQAEKAKAESDETGEEVKPFYIPYPISNATPEAVEQTMTEAGTGHFFLQSAEQGLVKILFGEGQKDRPKNFDLALKGFNGEFHAGVRVTRKKIEREVYGAVVCFAQAGSIKTILNNSDGDGLAERFLHIAEPHRLGQRTHNAGNLNEWMEQEYTALLDQLLMDFDQLQEKGDLDGLRYLGFSSEAMEVIRQFKIKLEPKMQLHADNGENSMTAFLAKADIQARKIAAVMYLSDCLSKCKPFLTTIPDHYLNASIELTEAALGHVEQVLTSLERMGPDAAKAAIYRQFDRKDGRTARELKQNLKKVKPFKDHATPNGYIERIIKGMVNRGELIFDPTDEKLRLG